MLSDFENGEVIARIGHPGDVQIFSVSEARAMLPVLLKVTQSAADDLAPLQSRLRRLLPCDPRIHEVEE